MSNPDLAKELEAALYEGEMDLACIKTKLHTAASILSTHNRETIEAHFDHIVGDIKFQLLRAMHANPRSRALPNMYQYFYELEPDRLFDSVVIIRTKLGEFLDSKKETASLQKDTNSDEPENDTEPHTGTDPEEFKTLINELNNFLEGNDLQYVARCISSGQMPLLTAFGQRLSEEKQLEFFLAMSRFYPLDTFFTVLMGKAAAKTGEAAKVKYAIDKLLVIGNNQKTLPTAGALARRIFDRERMIAVMNALEPYLQNARCLNEYTFLAVEARDRAAVEKALSCLESHDVNEGSLKGYSKAAYFLKDHHRMRGIIRVLEDHLHVIPLLKEYVILAITLRDPKALEISASELEKYLEHRWFLLRYSHLVRIVNDFEGMVKAQILLRRRLDDQACRKSHDILEDRIKMEIQRREFSRQKCGTG